MADRTLKAALATLPERDQEILMLTAWESLTPREIAAVVGIPANLVRVRLHRARSRLADRLTRVRVHRQTSESVILKHRA